ncbi:MAG: hypothetical protein ACOCU8_01460 [Patescibacteria group bacterium]
MEKKFKKGEIVRPKRGLLKKLLFSLISRTEIKIVEDIGETQYVGEDFKSIAVIVRDVDGNIESYSQDGLEKI